MLEQRRKRCTGVHWFANELLKAIVLLKINELSTRHTPGQCINFTYYISIVGVQQLLLLIMLMNPLQNGIGKIHYSCIGAINTKPKTVVRKMQAISAYHAIS